MLFLLHLKSTLLMKLPICMAYFTGRVRADITQRSCQASVLDSRIGSKVLQRQALAEVVLFRKDVSAFNSYRR
jgi:hypothetical protein